MAHDPKQLIVETDPKGLCILGHPFRGDEYIPGEDLSLGVIKTYDVRKGIMRQVLQIDFQKSLVRAEDIIQLPQSEAFGIQYSTYPIGIVGFIVYQKIRFKMKLDHS